MSSNAVEMPEIRTMEICLQERSGVVGELWIRENFDIRALVALRSYLRERPALLAELAKATVAPGMSTRDPDQSIRMTTHITFGFRDQNFPPLIVILDCPRNSQEYPAFVERLSDEIRSYCDRHEVHAVAVQALARAVAEKHRRVA